MEAPLGVLRDQAPAVLEGVSHPLTGIVLAGVSFVLAAAALLLIRGAASVRGDAPVRQATWGCGFAAPTPRMQYTGQSFVWTLLRSFRFLVRSTRSAERPAGCFPAAVTLRTAAPDAAETHLWRPVLEAVARFARRLWPLQQGRIQLYLLYVVAAVLVLFVIETWSRPTGATRPAGSDCQAFSRRRKATFPGLRA